MYHLRVLASCRARPLAGVDCGFKGRRYKFYDVYTFRRMTFIVAVNEWLYLALSNVIERSELKIPLAILK